jgi:hypothetical protein
VIEDWVNSRLLRDSFIPVLWEGTSVINAIDTVRRAIGRAGAQRVLQAELHRLLGEAEGLPVDYRERLHGLADRAIGYAEQAAEGPSFEKYSRLATSLLYHALSAVLLAWEGCRLGQSNGDARRLVMSRFVVEHRLDPASPLAPPAVAAWEEEAEELLLGDAPVSLSKACALVTAGRNA